MAAVNVLLLLFTYLVYQDLSLRNTYAEDLTFVPTTSYSILTHVFTLTGRGAVWPSPPTLDWPQVLILALLLYDAVFLFGLLRSRSSRQGGPRSPEVSTRTLCSDSSRLRNDLK